jgi:arylsulfatase A-like enzyme
MRKRPNIVCIFTDDHAFQAISAYGHPISKLAPTPNIDKLAAQGMIFTHAFVENSICTPSRATLLTGLYSHQHGQTLLGNRMDTSKAWFVELLQKAGYQTSVFGKWHLNVDPKGFDYYDILFDQGRLCYQTNYRPRPSMARWPNKQRTAVLYVGESQSAASQLDARFG